MEYPKQALTFEQQADLLINRGLIADRNLLINRLRSVNYYRFSGYLYPYRNSDDTFHSGTTFQKVWRHYTFDRRLRVIVMDAIERVEVAVRTQAVYHFVHHKGPFGHAVATNLPRLTAEEHEKWLSCIDLETRKSHEIFVKHFFIKYGDRHEHLPLWMTAEIMTFGMMLTFFNGVEAHIKQAVAEQYNIPDEVLHSWLRALNAIRNICAHHGRLWNRELGYKPKLPNERKYPDWHKPVALSNNRIFIILTILKYLLNIIAPQSGWSNRLASLKNEYPEISLRSMGYPVNWEQCPFWSTILSKKLEGGK